MYLISDKLFVVFRVRKAVKVQRAIVGVSLEDVSIFAILP